MSIYCYSDAIFFCRPIDVSPFYSIIYYGHNIDTFISEYMGIIYKAQTKALRYIKARVTLYYYNEIEIDSLASLNNCSCISNYKIIKIKKGDSHNDIISQVKLNYEALQPHVYDSLVISTKINNLWFVDALSLTVRHSDDHPTFNISKLFIISNYGHEIVLTHDQLCMIISVIKPKKLHVVGYKFDTNVLSVNQPLDITSIKFFNVDRPDALTRS
jgi:hypothetical protein